MTLFPGSIDKHTLAVICLAGSSLDVLGALYLAYDLLGGQHGPLRTLTRAVTYGALFGVGYGLALLDPVFGLISGAAHGITLGFEYSRASRKLPLPGFWMDAAMSSIRGLGFGLGAAYLFGGRFGAAFGILSAVGQTIAYQLGIRPGLDYKSDTRPHVSWKQMLAAANRTVGYTAAGYFSSLLAANRAHALGVGLRTGFSIGVVTAISGICTPLIEWAADHVPERRLGAFGIALILIGFTLQSVQYWLVLFNVRVT